MLFKRRIKSEPALNMMQRAIEAGKDEIVIDVRLEGVEEALASMRELHTVVKEVDMAIDQMMNKAVEAIKEIDAL